MAQTFIGNTGAGGANTGETVNVPNGTTGDYILHNNSDSTVRGTVTSSGNISYTFDSADHRSFGGEASVDGNDFDFVLYGGATIFFSASGTGAARTITFEANTVNTAHGTSAQNTERVVMGRV